MKVLLLGGPFDWRTMTLPDDFVGPSLYLPMPGALDYSLLAEAEANAASCGLDDVLKVAEYVSGHQLVTHDYRSGKPVYQGRLFDFVDVK